MLVVVDACLAMGAASLRIFAPMPGKATTELTSNAATYRGVIAMMIRVAFDEKKSRRERQSAT